MAKSERLEMRVDTEFLTLVDDWRRQQPDLPPRAEAIRRLVEAGLAADRGALERVFAKLWHDLCQEDPGEPAVTAAGKLLADQKYSGEEVEALLHEAALNQWEAQARRVMKNFERNREAE